MTQQLATVQVWQSIEKELFAVIGMVTASNESRTAGVVYAVHDHKLFFLSGKETWKVRHIAANPHVSLTIPIAKRIPVMPWVKVPAATITFSGVARVMPASEASPELRRALLRGLADDEAMLAGSSVVEVTPAKDFVTYGVGVSLMEMRHPDQARGRAPVNGQG